jgi:hypothetical protein
MKSRKSRCSSLQLKSIQAGGFTGVRCEIINGLARARARRTGTVRSQEACCGSRTRPGDVEFPHPRSFWLGTAAVTAGVVLHLPMLFDAAEIGYRLEGMGADAPMKGGMVLILAGLAATGVR